MQFRQQITTVAEGLAPLSQVAQLRFRGFPIQQHTSQQIGSMMRHIRKRQMALPFGSPTLSHCQQPRQLTVASTIFRQQYDRRGRRRNNFRTDQQRQIQWLGSSMGTDHPGQTVAISDGKSGMVQSSRSLNQFIRMRRRLQERVVRQTMQFRITSGLRGIRQHDWQWSSPNLGYRLFRHSVVSHCEIPSQPESRSCLG